jgi:hypothetical protein
MSDQIVNVPVSEFQRLQADAAQAKARIAQIEIDAASAATRERLARGETESVVRETRAQVEAAREEASRAVAAAELSKALASRSLVPAGAEQLTRLWANELRTDRNPDGTVVVRTKAAFQPVGDFVNQKLGSPEYAHYLASSQAAPASPANPNNQPAAPPKNAGEFFLQQARANAAAPAQADASSDLSQPFGLPTRGSASPISRGAIPGLGRLLGR